MDFVEIDFETIRKHIYLISPDQPIEEYKNVYKSGTHSYKKGTHSYKAVMEMIKPVTIKPMSTKIIV